MSDEIKWPREIWMQDLDEHHNGLAFAVLSEHATIPRWEGDVNRECAFHRYVDADIHDSADRYYRHRIEELEAKLAKAVEALEYYANHEILLLYDDAAVAKDAIAELKGQDQ